LGFKSSGHFNSTASKKVMEILTPDIGLLIWTLLSLTSFVFFMIALIGLLRNRYWPDTTTKLMWAIIIIFVPTIGLVLYLIIGKKQNRATTH